MSDAGSQADSTTTSTTTLSFETFTVVHPSKFANTSHRSLGLAWCAGRCFLKSRTVAAVEHRPHSRGRIGLFCFCGDVPPASAARVDDAECDVEVDSLALVNHMQKCRDSLSTSAAAPPPPGSGTTPAKYDEAGATFCGPQSLRRLRRVYEFVCDDVPSLLPGAPIPKNHNVRGLPPPPHTKEPTTQDYYEGVFTRLQKRVPDLDWYWIWTPEAWEWSQVGASDPLFQQATEDLQAAMAAKQKIGFPNNMATNGWVVGPLPDRSIFDSVLGVNWDAITSIDLNVGKAPVDPSYQKVVKHNKWAIPWLEDDPDLCAPQLWVNRTLEHMEDAKRYGCTGLLGIHWRTRALSPQISAMARKSWNSKLKSEAFWESWAEAQFGGGWKHAEKTSSLASKAAAIFSSVDSFKLPVVVAWTDGPSQLVPQCLNMSSFAFVDQFGSLRDAVSGVLNLARFDYWHATLKFLRGIAETSCAWKRSNDAMAEIRKGKTDTERKNLAWRLGVPARVNLVRSASDMMHSLQLTLSTPGELGTYTNLESRSLVSVLNATEAATLETYLGAPLPAAAIVPKTFRGGEARLIVPVVRSTAEKGETFKLRALVLGDCTDVQLFTRRLGSSSSSVSGDFRAIKLSNRGRSVFELGEGVFVPREDFEWYLTGTGCGAVFPPGKISQTVVMISPTPPVSAADGAGGAAGRGVVEIFE